MTCFVIDTGNEQGIDLLVFTGGGYGHGVGMSQNGAKHLAEDGMGLAGDPAGFLSEYYDRKLAGFLKK